MKKSKSYGSTVIKPLFGKARAAQLIRQAWAAERHAPAPGAARQQVSGGQYRGKRGRSA